MRSLAQLLIGIVGVYLVAGALPWLGFGMMAAGFEGMDARSAWRQYSIFAFQIVVGLGLFVTRGLLANALVRDEEVGSPETASLEVVGFAIVGLYLAANGLATGAGHVFLGWSSRVVAEGLRLILGLVLFFAASRLARWRASSAGN